MSPNGIRQAVDDGNASRIANPFDLQWQPYFAERAFNKKSGITRQQAGIKPP